MNIWTRKDRRTYFDDAEDLAYGPSGGSVKQWLLGVIVAAIPVLYGVFGLVSGHTILPGRSASTHLSGAPAFWLDVAYVALGGFLHSHYFWGLNSRLLRFSQPLKTLALLIFLPSFIYALRLEFF